MAGELLSSMTHPGASGGASGGASADASAEADEDINVYLSGESSEDEVIEVEDEDADYGDD